MVNSLHIGLIMDGNGRWATARHLPRTAGHLAGLKALKRVALGAIRNNVGYLTLYCFSNENWKRPQTELDALAREDLKLLTRSGIAPDIVHPAKPEAAVGQGKDAARAVCLF